MCMMPWLMLVADAYWVTGGTQKEKISEDAGSTTSAVPGLAIHQLLGRFIFR